MWFWFPIVSTSYISYNTEIFKKFYFKEAETYLLTESKFDNKGSIVGVSQLFNVKKKTQLALRGDPNIEISLLKSITFIFYGKDSVRQKNPQCEKSYGENSKLQCRRSGAEAAAAWRQRGDW